MKTSQDSKILIVGASPNPSRYAYLAAEMLLEYGYEIALFSNKKAEVLGRNIINNWDEIPKDIHTVTLYVGPDNQKGLTEKILGIKPRRIIFNPGTENPQFMEEAKQSGIEVLEACTLVLLRTEQF